MPDLVEDREAVVKEVVEHLVEEAAGSLREQLLTQLLVLLAAIEEARDRKERHVRERDDVVLGEEDVELGRVQPLDRLVVDRKVEDGEEVLRVLVDLRPLPPRENVLDVERVPAEALGELVRGVGIRAVEVDPRQSAGGELERAAFSDRAGRDRAGARPRPPDAGQVGHTY